MIVTCSQLTFNTFAVPHAAEVPLDCLSHTQAIIQLLVSTSSLGTGVSKPSGKSTRTQPPNLVRSTDENYKSFRRRSMHTPVHQDTRSTAELEQVR